MDLNKIIAIVREEMMSANPAGGSGGFSGSADPKGPRAGYDPVMKKMTRRLSRRRNMDMVVALKRRDKRKETGWTELSVQQPP